MKQKKKMNWRRLKGEENAITTSIASFLPYDKSLIQRGKKSKLCIPSQGGPQNEVLLILYLTKKNVPFFLKWYTACLTFQTSISYSYDFYTQYLSITFWGGGRVLKDKWCADMKMRFPIPGDCFSQSSTQSQIGRSSAKPATINQLWSNMY